MNRHVGASSRPADGPVLGPVLGNYGVVVLVVGGELVSAELLRNLHYIRNKER